MYQFTERKRSSRRFTLEAERLLGLSYVSISAHSRHIQQGPALSENQHLSSIVKSQAC